MSHVLLSGNTEHHPWLRNTVQGWGYTVGELAGPAPTVPDVGACDMVIHVGTPETAPGAMPDGAQEAGGAASAAPLLVITGAGPVPGAFEVLPEAGPSAVLLRAAMARAQARTRELRNGGAGDDRRGFHQFLGHELRSPLAAMKTALEVLRREDSIADDASRMVDLGLRNVDRLAAAVEWSQDLRELEEDPPVPRLRDVPLGDLARELEGAGFPVRNTTDPSRPVVTDPALLVSLAHQLERVLATAYPGGGLEIVFAGASAGEGLDMVFLTDGDPRPAGGLQMGDPGDGPPEAERLAHLMCSPCLYQILGLAPRAHRAADGRGGLSVSLPLSIPVPAP